MKIKKSLIKNLQFFNHPFTHKDYEFNLLYRIKGGKNQIDNLGTRRLISMILYLSRIKENFKEGGLG